MSTIEQGDIFDYDFGPRSDNRQEGKRPALVIQSDRLNELPNYGLTVIVPLTTKGRPSPTHVSLEPSQLSGLTALSFAKGEQLFTVPVEELGQRRGNISKHELFRVKEALRIVLEL